MVFKLVESPQDRWRGLTGAHLVALAPFRRQVRELLVEREEVAAA
ncbi:hypothetical protein ACFWVF_21560 [Streptomyces sp. NPDC058659]